MERNGTLVAALLGLAYFSSSALPARLQVRSQILEGSPEQVARSIEQLREAYGPSLLFGAGLGAALSILTRSRAPLTVGTAAAAVQIAAYETALPPELRIWNQPVAEIGG